MKDEDYNCFMSYLKTGVIPQCKKKQFLFASKSFEIQTLGNHESLFHLKLIKGFFYKTKSQTHELHEMTCTEITNLKENVDYEKLKLY
jgi:hypothetical protein